MSISRNSLAATVIEAIKKHDNIIKSNISNPTAFQAGLVFYQPKKFCDVALPRLPEFTEADQKHWKHGEVIVPLQTAAKGFDARRLIDTIIPLVRDAGIPMKMQLPDGDTNATLNIHFFLPREYFTDGRFKYKFTSIYTKHFLLGLLKKLTETELKLAHIDTVDESLIPVALGSTSFNIYYKTQEQEVTQHPCRETKFTDADLENYRLTGDHADKSLDLEYHATILAASFMQANDFVARHQSAEIRDSFRSRADQAKKLLRATHQVDAKMMDETFVTKIEEIAKNNLADVAVRIETEATKMLDYLISQIQQLHKKVSFLGGKELSYQGKTYRLPTHAADMLTKIKHNRSCQIADAVTLEQIQKIAVEAARQTTQKLFSRRKSEAQDFYDYCSKLKPSLPTVSKMLDEVEFNTITKQTIHQLVRTYRREFHYGTENVESMKAGALKSLFGIHTRGIQDLIDFLNSAPIQALENNAPLRGDNLYRLLDIIRKRETRTYGTLSGYDLSPEKATNVIFIELLKKLQEGCDAIRTGDRTPLPRELTAVEDVLMQRRSNKVYFNLSDHAKRGYPESMYQFAVALLDGKARESNNPNRPEVVIRKNKAKAIKLLNKAAAANHPEAIAKLEQLRAESAQLRVVTDQAEPSHLHRRGKK